MSSRQLSGSTGPICAACALAAAVVYTYGSTLWALGSQWATDANYTHGFAIVPLAFYFGWRRRTAVSRAQVRSGVWGLAIVLLAFTLLAVGRTAADAFLARTSFVVLIAGGVLFVFGPSVARALAFPLGFLVLMVPLPAILFNQVAFPLQQLASVAGAYALRTGGVPVLRQGNVLELASIRLEVAQGCSGVRSLMTLVAFALVVGELGRHTTPRRMLLAAATIPIVVIANAARVAATGFAADRFGSVAAEGMLHAAVGSVLFVTAAGGLLCVEAVLRRGRTRRVIT